MQYHALSILFKISQIKNPKTMSVQSIYQVTIYFFTGNRELEEGEEPEEEELDFVHQLHLTDEDAVKELAKRLASYLDPAVVSNLVFKAEEKRLYDSADVEEQHFDAVANLFGGMNEN